jgi:hypothetical protein
VHRIGVGRQKIAKFIPFTSARSLLPDKRSECTGTTAGGMAVCARTTGNPYVVRDNDEAAAIATSSANENCCGS